MISTEHFHFRKMRFRYHNNYTVPCPEDAGKGGGRARGGARPRGPGQARRTQDRRQHDAGTLSRRRQALRQTLRGGGSGCKLSGARKLPRALGHFEQNARKARIRPRAALAEGAVLTQPGLARETTEARALLRVRREAASGPRALTGFGLQDPRAIRARGRRGREGSKAGRGEAGLVREKLVDVPCANTRPRALNTDHPGESYARVGNQRRHRDDCAEPRTLAEIADRSCG